MQIEQKRFKCNEIQIRHFEDNIENETFNILHDFQPLTVATLSTPKNSQIFCPPKTYNSQQSVV